MTMQDNLTAALANRSLRNIRTELEFLSDAAIITPQQLSAILSQLPEQAPVPQAQTSQTSSAPAYTPPTTQLANTTLNEKVSQQPAPVTAPPPAYTAPPILSIASALYAYTPTDAGDLALQPNDRIQVLEHMNNDWWRGRNERTNLEGIFPRSYVTVIDEKPGQHVSPQPTSYGNLPLEISQSGSTTPSGGRRPSKLEEHGKKFGKKMGNAAIFGAGATIGSNIVNGIF